MLPFQPPNRSTVPPTTELQTNKGKISSCIRISLLLILILMLVVWFSEIAIAKYATSKINSANPATNITVSVESVDVDLFGRNPKITLSQLTMLNQTDQSELNNANISINFLWSDLLKGQPIPDNSTVANANIIVAPSKTKTDLISLHQSLIGAYDLVADMGTGTKVDFEKITIKYLDPDPGKVAVFNLDGTLDLGTNPGVSSLNLIESNHSTPTEVTIKGVINLHDHVSDATDLDLSISNLDSLVTANIHASPLLSEKQFQFKLEADISNLHSQLKRFGFNTQRIPDIAATTSLFVNTEQAQVKALNIQWGSSDLQSTISMIVDQPKPLLTIEIQSNQLNLDLLTENTPTTTADLADSPLNTEQETGDLVADLNRWIAGFDTKASINLKNILYQDFNAGTFHVKTEVDDNVLHGTLLSRQADDGEISASLRYTLDDLGLADGNFHLRSHNMNLSKFPLPATLANTVSEGNLSTEIELWFGGQNGSEMIGSLDGELYTLFENGKIDALAVEVAGADLMEVLSFIFGRDRKKIAVKCGYANINIESGVAEIDHFLIDTDDTLFSADGSIDLNQEILDLIITPSPHDSSLFSATTPLLIRGTFKKPKIRPSRKLYARLAAAAALATVAAPAALLLPFITLGDGKQGQNCEQLFSHAQ